jgi:hypothetical protein
MSTAAGDMPPESLVSLINELAEPLPPDPVSMVPQTAGWAVLACLLAGGTAILLVRAWRRWRADAYRRAGLLALDAAGADAAAIAEVMRRAALSAWPRAEVASLTGRGWLVFLDESGGKSAFSGRPAGAELLQAPYGRSIGPASAELQAAARSWMRGHRVPPCDEEGQAA